MTTSPEMVPMDAEQYIGIVERTAADIVNVAKSAEYVEVSIAAASLALVALYAQAAQQGERDAFLRKASAKLSRQLKNIAEKKGLHVMARSFERTAIRVPGAPNLSGYSIKCSKCGVSEKISTNNRSGSMPPEGLIARFRAKGWIVGNREGSDICPSCVEKQKKIKPVKENNVVELNTAIKAEPPREMSRDDRRVIFAKINDVYLDEKQGYSREWSDRRVAEDLGVPLAWVKTIREENFGIEARNEDVGPIFADAKSLLEEISVVERIITERLMEAQKSKDDLSSRANHIAGRIAKLEKAF